MPLSNYGVLRGSVIDHRLASGANAHFQLHVVDDTTHYRTAVNVESQMQPSELEYLIDSNFRHQILEAVAALPGGWNVLGTHKPGGAALDFIGVTSSTATICVSFRSTCRPDNDLNEKLAHYVRRTMADEQATVYACGQRWGPEQGKTDKIFGFAIDFAGWKLADRDKHSMALTARSPPARRCGCDSRRRSCSPIEAGSSRCSTPRA